MGDNASPRPRCSVAGRSWVTRRRGEHCEEWKRPSRRIELSFSAEQPLQGGAYMSELFDDGNTRYFCLTVDDICFLGW